MSKINSTSTQSNQLMVAVLTTNVEAIAELAPIASIIITVNMLVIVVFLKTKKLRTPANYILFSFAISDFMTGALNIPLFVIVSHTPVISSNKARFYLGFLVTVLHTMTAVLSVYHIVIATLEMYLSIIWPVIHRLVIKTTVSRAILVVWFFSVLVGFAPFAWINITRDPSGAKFFMGYVIFCFAMVFTLPYIFMIYAFIKIFQALSRRQEQRIKHRSRRRRKLTPERKCTVLFVSMATLFAVCWFPWFTLMLLFSLNFNAQALNTPAHVFTLVRYITSVINPFLYSLLRPDFYKALKNMKCAIVVHALSVTATCRFSQQRRGSRQTSEAGYVMSCRRTSPCRVSSTTPEQLQARSGDTENLTEIQNKWKDRNNQFWMTKCYNQRRLLLKQYPAGQALDNPSFFQATILANKNGGRRT